MSDVVEAPFVLRFGLSMGQWLSLPMILVGLAMMAWAYRRKPGTDPGFQ